MAKSVKQEFEWLVIFLIYNNDYYDLETEDTQEYFTMEEQTRYILHQLKIAKHNDNVKVVIAEAAINNGSRDTFITLSVSEKDQNEIVPIKKPITAQNVGVMTDYDSVAKILGAIKEMFKANKHLIVTAGHGSIVGINYFIPKLNQKVANHALREEIKTVRDEIKYEYWENTNIKLSIDHPVNFEVGPSLLSFKKEKAMDVTFELKDGRMLKILTNLELSEAFETVFGKKTVDVLVMYNCLMQNLFTQYDFRNTVDWFVAPLSGISIPGYNYTHILDQLNANATGLDGEKVAELFTTSIRDSPDYNIHKDDIEQSWKISAIKMNYKNYELIQGEFNALFNEMSRLSSTGNIMVNCINETLNQLFSYSHYCLNNLDVPDIGIFLEYLKEKINDEFRELRPLITQIDRLQTALSKQTVKYFFKGDNFYINGTPHMEDKPRFSSTIVNTALLLPFRNVESDLLQLMYADESYSNTKENKYKVPSFLKNNSYATIVNKLLKLPKS